MRGELRLEEGIRLAKRGATSVFASFPRSRWSYAILLVVTTAALVATAVHHYRTVDRELTEVALSRRAAVAQLVAAAFSENFARLVDIAVPLATRVRFRELVAAGRWIEAGELQREVPRDIPFIDRLFLTDLHGALKVDGVRIGFNPLEREDQISAFAPVPGYGWGVIVQQPTRATLALKVRNDPLQLPLVAYGLVLVLGASALCFVARIAAEHARAEEDRRMKAELEAANKELESFSYSVSHRRWTSLQFSETAAKAGLYWLLVNRTP